MILFLTAFFAVPALKAGACEMAHKTGKSHQAAQQSPAAKNTIVHQADCCSQMPAAHQQKGHCTHDNCTNNSCHPVSIYSLHASSQLDITPLPVAMIHYNNGINGMEPTSYTYTIWQPPRLG